MTPEEKAKKKKKLLLELELAQAVEREQGGGGGDSKEPEEGTLSKLGAGVIGGFLKTPIGKMASKGISDIFEGGSEAKEPYSPRSVLERRTAAVTEPIVRIGTEVPLAIAGGGLPSGITKIPALSRLASSLMSGAAATAPSATTKVMEGKPKEALKEEAIGSGLGLGLGALGLATKALAGPLKSMGTRVQNVTTKILDKEARQGAKVENIGKYELFGSPKKAVENARKQIGDASKELKKVLGTTQNDPSNKINLGETFAKARAQATEGKTPVEQNEINAVIDKIESKFQSAYKSDAADLNLLDAQMLKQYVGKKGDWLSNAGKIGANPDATLEGQVHNTIYDALKTQLENKGGGEVKRLNTIMSELIPLERANAKRLLVSSRKNPISLDDYIGGLASAATLMAGNPLPALMTGVNIASKSPSVGGKLYRMGVNLEKGGPAAIKTGVVSSESARKLADRLRKK